MHAPKMQQNINTLYLDTDVMQENVQYYCFLADYTLCRNTVRLRHSNRAVTYSNTAVRKG